MDRSLFLAILGGMGAIFGLAGCLFAAYRHPYKRWLYLATAGIMAYFIWLVGRIVSSNITGEPTTAPLFREAISTVFFVIGLHGFFDGFLDKFYKRYG